MRRLLLVLVPTVAVAVAACTPAADRAEDSDPPAVQSRGTGSHPPAAQQLPVAGTAVELASLAVPRAAHTATTLPNGRVLIAGGCTSNGCDGVPRPGTEMYDPVARRFDPGPAMRETRASHTATPLTDGRVLIVGGWPQEGRPPLATAELYDPGTNTFTGTGPMADARGSHSATRMRDGRVLIVGGVNHRSALSSVEIYDPATGRFQAGPPLAQVRAMHAAALLAGGRVLVAGGQTGTGHGLGLVDTAVVYDPMRNAWQSVGRLGEAKYKLAIAPLLDGGALVIGGQTADDGAARLATTEVFDPATGAFRPGPTMAEPRYKISEAIVALRDGRVVLAGGRGVEVYGGGKLSRVAGTPDIERQSPGAAALGDGTVLVTGGYDDRTRLTSSAILVNPG